jgi:hypothetical protein
MGPPPPPPPPPFPPAHSHFHTRESLRSTKFMLTTVSRCHRGRSLPDCAAAVYAGMLDDEICAALLAQRAVAQAERGMVHIKRQAHRAARYAARAMPADPATRGPGGEVGPRLLLRLDSAAVRRCAAGAGLLAQHDQRRVVLAHARGHRGPIAPLCQDQRRRRRRLLRRSI